jgi:hypothetical protein
MWHVLHLIARPIEVLLGLFCVFLIAGCKQNQNEHNKHTYAGHFRVFIPGKELESINSCGTVTVHADSAGSYTVDMSDFRAAYTTDDEPRNRATKPIRRVISGVSRVEVLGMIDEDICLRPQ